MPEIPNVHDDQDDEEFDRLLRDAGARMRAATETAQSPAVRPTDGRATPPRWIVPVAIVMATAAAVVAAVWIAGPATESVREAPANTGVVPSIRTVPDPAVDLLREVIPIPSTGPSDTTRAPIGPADTTPAGSGAATSEVVSISVTDEDFDGAGGKCLRLSSASDTANGCITQVQLSTYPTWVVAFTDHAFEVTLEAVDPTGSSWTPIDDVCGYAPSSVITGRWLLAACEAQRLFWFVAAPESPGGESSAFVVPPSIADLILLEPIASELPDGYAAFRATGAIDGASVDCLVVAEFAHPWREACGDSNELVRLLLPAAGTVFLIESTPDLGSIEVTDIAVLSVPITGCSAPISDLAAAIHDRVMISGLICAGDSAMVTVPSVVLQSGPVDGAGYPLQRADDGTWSTVGGGTSFPCDADPLPACEALGVDGDLMASPLPIPPWGQIGARMHDLNPVEITSDVRSITGGARNADEIAAAVIAQYEPPEGSDGQTQ